MTDVQAFGLFSGLLLAAVAVGEGLRMAGWRAESSRRVVHVGVGLTVAASPTWFSGPGPIYALAAAFLVGNVVAIGRGWFPGMHGIKRRSWGTAVFPLALIVALWLCWTLNPGRVPILQAAFVVLALADPAASFVGARTSRRRRDDKAAKSVAGSVAFAVVAFSSTALVLIWAEWPVGDAVGSALVVAVLATAAEALGRGGWDNLWIVLAVIVPLAAIDAGTASSVGPVLALACAVVFGVAAWQAGSLNTSGALAATLLAWMLLAVGGVVWAVPAFTFFVASSAISRVGNDGKADAQELDQKGSRRDVGQVLANGGVAAAALAAVVFVEATWLYGAFVGAWAAAAADTWATEIGTAVGGQTRMVGSGRKVPPGTSGGVSLAGTLGMFLGAGLVVGAAVFVGGVGWALAPALVAVGIASATLDSVLGATVQARYVADGGRLAEVPQAPGQSPTAGVRGVGNDAVNWACTVAGGVGGALAWVVVG